MSETGNTPITSVLVANRGEIARRVIGTARRLRIRTVAIFSEVDSVLPFVAEADESYLLQGESPRTVYLDAEQILAIAVRTNCDAVHPGYGFLSESPEFAEAVCAAGLRWIGPSPESMIAMSDKVASRNAVQELGVPVLPGTPCAVHTLEEAIAHGALIGYPLMIKPSGGGGGIGMFAVRNEGDLIKSFGSAVSRAASAFGTSAVLLERLVNSPRHIEIQILGQPDHTVVALGERDCSVQRRHQKLLEESPSPIVDIDLRSRMSAAAIAVAESVRYVGAGTVEFLVDTETGDFVFLEMNTRLQVEHGVTEMRLGIDLVEQQFRIAQGLQADLDQAWSSYAHVIELRINAEDPVRFFPSPGTIDTWKEPSGDGVRIDAGYAVGTTVTQFYDSLLAKILVGGSSREDAIDRALGAIDDFAIEGVKTNATFLAHVLNDSEFRSGTFDTGIVNHVAASVRSAHPSTKTKG